MLRFANYGRCAQKICLPFAERFGLTPQQMLGLSAGFGSGMGHADTCGCITAAMILLGLRYAPESMDDAEKMAAILQEKMAEFEERFVAKRKSLLCREILDLDISMPGGMKEGKESGRFAEICFPMIAETCVIMKEMLNRDA